MTVGREVGVSAKEWFADPFCLSSFCDTTGVGACGCEE
jgi:hypothetical protein